MRLAEINLRDPFVLEDGGVYYLYGTRSETAWTDADGFDVYVSGDLENWSEPKEIFHNDGSFWATRAYWAPECIRYDGAYYLIATFGGDGRKKGIQFLKSDSPDGTFTPVTPFPVTRADWECLDGTFFESADGEPYLIFSHSVPEEVRGALCAAKLKRDFTGFAEEPRVLFYADEAPWTRPVPFAKTEFGIDGAAYLSDGPYIVRGDDGALLLLWSSWSDCGGYAMGISTCRGTSLFGSWTHGENVIARGGGHGMVFRTVHGELLLTYHSPNDKGKEHPVFVPFPL